eukprot:1984587-Prymnesium_polylepis.1
MSGSYVDGSYVQPAGAAPKRDDRFTGHVRGPGVLRSGRDGFGTANGGLAPRCVMRTPVGRLKPSKRRKWPVSSERSAKCAGCATRSRSNEHSGSPGGQSLRLAVSCPEASTVTKRRDLTKRSRTPSRMGAQRDDGATFCSPAAVATFSLAAAAESSPGSICSSVPGPCGAARRGSVGASPWPRMNSGGR